jgi:plastocyanin
MQRPALRPLAIALSGAALGLVLLAGCSNDDQGPAAAAPPATGATRIVAKANAFTPAAVSIPPGATLTWSFEDGAIPHDVKGGGMDSGGPRSKGTFTHRFDQPGTYDYRCSLHPGMTGRVEVR